VYSGTDVGQAFWFGVVVGVAAAICLWVTLAVIAGVVAHRRGYPRVAGLAIGLLTGPLAIVAVALLPSRRDRQIGTSPMAGTPDVGDQDGKTRKRLGAPAPGVG
jgi:hypothetical protein